MIPVPSEERSLHPKRFRGAPRLYDHDRATVYLYKDEQRKIAEQDRFTNQPHNMVYRGLSREPPLLDESRRRLKYVPPPQEQPHPVGKRCPHRVPPVPAEVQLRLFPPGGLVERPEAVRAASCMEMHEDQHFINHHISPRDWLSENRPSRKVFPHALERTTRGDMSLAVTGVKKVALPLRNDNPDYITGFRGMGQQSIPAIAPTGTKRVAPTDWDPLGFIHMYGRRH